MTKITILPAAKVGEHITKFVVGMAKTADDLHEILVQCALHVREHGDTSLAQRLVDELSDNPDVKLKGAAAVNVQGIRFWFGSACPMTQRNGKWKLLDKDSNAYSAYIDRMMGATKSDDHKEGQPDTNMGPGSRIFFVDYCSTHPFWNMDEVRSAQRNNIRVLGTTQVIGLALAAKAQYQKSIDEGRFGGDPKIADAFMDGLTKYVEDFRKKHAADLIGEPQRLEDFKRTLAEQQQDEAQAEVNAAGQPEGGPQVGGDVTEGVRTSDEDTERTGTEG